jgi:hypothetical protein
MFLGMMAAWLLGLLNAYRSGRTATSKLERRPVYFSKAVAFYVILLKEKFYALLPPRGLTSEKKRPIYHEAH